MTFWPVLFLVSTCDPAPALEGKQFFDQGKFAQAETQFRRALEQSCDAAQRFTARVNLAATLRERNAPAEAKEMLLAATEMPQMPAEMRISYWNCLALVEEHSGNSAKADAAYLQAVALITPATPPRLAMQTWANVARQRMKQGRLREAEEALAQPAWQHDRTLTYQLNLAELRRMQGRPREAEDTLRALLKQGGPLPAQVRGAAANNLASFAATRGEHAQAEALWREANGAWREAYGASHPIVAKGLNNLAAHYVARKRYAEAESLYREAIAMQTDPLMLNNLATLLHQRGRLTESEELYRRALSLFEKPRREAIQPHGNLAVLLADTGRVDEALAQFQIVVRLLPLTVPDDEPTAARYLERYESMLRKRKEPAEAERVAALAMRYRVRSALRAED
jgi:tetratricopeptide (TPR) repeat protein